MRKKKLKWLLLIMIITLLGTGMEFFNDPVELDPGDKDHMLFQERTVEGIYADQTSGLKDPCYAITGKISDIGKKYDTFKLTSEDGKKVIECRSNELKVKNRVAELSPGDRITAFGKVKKKLLSSGLSAEVYFLPGETEASGSGSYAAGNGNLYSSRNTCERKIINPGAGEDDVITYRIPEEWKMVEKKLDDKGDHIYGYQYRLNKIKGEKVPESLYVFYFDFNKNLLDRSQYDQTANIEAAIVRNILGKKDVGKCPESVIKAPYGTEYHYYDDKFEDGDDIYHLEFVFRKSGIKGLIVYMYIYRLPERAEDVMYVMRTTEEDLK